MTILPTKQHLKYAFKKPIDKTGKEITVRSRQNGPDSSNIIVQAGFMLY